MDSGVKSITGGVNSIFSGVSNLFGGVNSIFGGLVYFYDPLLGKSHSSLEKNVQLQISSNKLILFT